MPGPLLLLLGRKAGSAERAQKAIMEVADLVGAVGSTSDEALAALALCKMGVSPENVSKTLSWRDFESFCSSILRAKGYTVRENIYLRKPRAQIDVLGISTRLSVAVDCKHWTRSSGYSSLARIVEAQKARAMRLHDTLDSIGPIAPVILTLVDQGARFVDGGAIVPVFALRDFLDNIDAHEPLMDLA
ncbi:MAG: restriction endonuclease [Nitrososphaerota archaeon]|nr:restriction endonuclease [Nitrososphaerota archaeon]